MSKIFTCPLSNQNLMHPCPCINCPGNLSAYNRERSCALVLPDTSYSSLSEATGLETAELRQTSQMQAIDFATLVRDYRSCTEAAITGCCTGCGYVRPCTSRTLCDERRVAVEEILVKTVHDRGLKPRHIWHAVVHRQASFLPTQVLAKLRELVSARDTGEHDE